MPTVKLNFDGPERLRQILDTVIDEYSKRILSIHITMGELAIDLDENIEFNGFGANDLWDQLGKSRVVSYDYAGPFSLAVIRNVYKKIKREDLVPTFLLIHPDSLMKETSEWRDLVVSTVVETTFFGLRVVESEAIDEMSFVVAAGHSPKCQIHNVVMGVKGQINAIQ